MSPGVFSILRLHCFPQETVDRDFFLNHLVEILREIRSKDVGFKDSQDFISSCKMDLYHSECLCESLEITLIWEGVCKSVPSHCQTST